MSKVVQFCHMEDGSREDYLMLQELEHQFCQKLPQRILDCLKAQGDDSMSGYQITRLEHSLQAATRAYHDGASEDWIVASLLHDIGDGLAPFSHDRFAAEIIRPFVTEECTWVIAHHGIFQKYYYVHHYGGNRDERLLYKDNPYYQSCVDFCHRWDQNSFDPNHEILDLDFFAPMVDRVLSREAYDSAHIKQGQMLGLETVV